MASDPGCPGTHNGVSLDPDVEKMKHLNELNAIIDWDNPNPNFLSNPRGLPPLELPVSPEILSPDQVRKRARKFTAQIFGNKERLQAILQRHKPRINTRWCKFGKSRREEILRSAWPKISTFHRPDYWKFQNEAPHNLVSGTAFRDAYMWPWINLEDLSARNVFPLFLHTRGHNDPDRFALADWDSIQFGSNVSAIMPCFLARHTMMFANRKTPEDYGEIFVWDDKDVQEASRWTKAGRIKDWPNKDNPHGWFLCGKGLLPGPGLLVLEIQEGILHFLLQVCKHILQDIPDDKLTSNMYSIQPLMTLPMETVDGFASFAVMAAEAPYRLPANMDLPRLESLVAARKSAAEDHIWALREDPGYFADTILEYKEHRVELLEDTYGQQHPLLAANEKDKFWAQTICTVVREAYCSLEMWAQLHFQVNGLRRLQIKHAKNIHIDKELPEEYLEALLAFLFYLEEVDVIPKVRLQRCAPASPPLRPYFNRRPRQDSNESAWEAVRKLRINRKGEPYEALKLLPKEARRVVDLLQLLWESRLEFHIMGLQFVIDTLERQIEKHEEAKQMISPYVSAQISDLAVLGEATRQVLLYQPWAQTFVHCQASRPEEDKIKFNYQNKAYKLVDSVSYMLNWSEFVKFVKPDKKRFCYPIDKRRTKENVEAMLSAECNLDKF